ncbi:unnamed protein product [Adineta steineri]|uniref:Stress-response A/B barrel domain-containing protein n=1 Tax=Adineta steineri TaxID=433720 RepID=A0A814ZZA1_9BILA|nr:unnamed protein product [Adineta steineri]CAF1064744.1 unnamed protein product [Adineta steineri]CAF1248018.1 unnamed protein product [Adineta steineri]CAF1488966.1 unnamed protein product [Adineta steineri]CAF1640919.1 unnamed protein product [Adineta steineri]
MAETKQLRHVVLFKFKENTPPADISHIEDEFRTLATVKIPEIKAYEWGTNVSKENLDHGYTHCFILTFANEQDRDMYIDHPDHKAFVDILKPHLAEPTVIDFWVHH